MAVIEKFTYKGKTIEHYRLVCDRCGHGGEGKRPWITRTSVLPNSCVVCKSWCWNRPDKRTREERKKAGR